MVSKELYQSTKDWVNVNRKERSALFITLDASEDRPIISICSDGNQDYIIASLVFAMEQNSMFRTMVEIALKTVEEDEYKYNSEENTEI